MKRIAMVVAVLATVACGGSPQSNECTTSVTEGASGYTYHREVTYTNEVTGTIRVCTTISQGPEGQVISWTTCVDRTDPANPVGYPTDEDPCY